MDTKLKELVGVLTRDHKVAVKDDEGKLVFRTEMSYLNQLSFEIYSPSSTGKGGSSVTKSKLLFSAGAHDLMHEINTVSALHSNPRFPLPARIQDWSSKAAGDEQSASECLAWVEKWVADIKALQAPPTLDITGRCPECHAVEYREDIEGEVVRRTTFVATVEVVTCRNCQAEWVGQDEMLALRKLI